MTGPGAESWISVSTAVSVTQSAMSLTESLLIKIPDTDTSAWPPIKIKCLRRCNIGIEYAVRSREM